MKDSIKVHKGFIAPEFRQAPLGKVRTVMIAESVAPRFFNSYLVSAKFMIGDADGDLIEEKAFPLTATAEMYEFLQFLVDCANLYRNGKGGYDSYEEVHNYDKYIDEGEWLDGWPEDSDMDGIYHSLEGFEVFYYDEFGQKSKVSVVIEG